MPKSEDMSLLKAQDACPKEDADAAAGSAATPERPARRVTLREIAARAGLHVTAVSMALRNHSRISAATRARVQALAGEMGYRQDALLSALCRYRSKSVHHSTLAWINTFPRDIGTRVHLYGEYLRGVRKRAEELGFGLLEIELGSGSDMSIGRARAILRARNISAVLIPPQPFGHRLELPWDELAAVAFGYSFTSPRLHAVVPNQYTSTQTIMAELRALGYRRIGAYVDEETDRRCNHHWTAAYWVDYHAHPGEERVAPLTYRLATRDPAEIRAWATRERVEVVFVVGNVNMPLDLPPGVEKVYHSVNATQPDRAGIDENGLLTGATAVDMLVGMLSRQEIGVPKHPHRVLIDGFWQPGNLRRRQAQAAKS